MSQLLASGQCRFSSLVFESRLNITLQQMAFLFSTNLSNLSPLKLALITLICIGNLSRKASFEWIVRLSMGSSSAKIRSLWLKKGMSLQSHCGTLVTLFQSDKQRELPTSYFLHTFAISFILKFPSSGKVSIHFLAHHIECWQPSVLLQLASKPSI